MLATEEQGFYENQGFGPDFTVRTQSRFTGPDCARPLPMAGGRVARHGAAGDRGVTQVKVSVDDGASWKPATVDDAGSRLTWSLWCYRWTVDHDGTGAPQTDESKASGAGGSTGRHRVTANLA